MRAARWAALLAVATALAACGSGSSGSQSVSPSAAPASTFHVSAPPPDPTTAEGIAVLALTQIYSWRPATEQPGVALLRAARWLGPRLRAVLDNPPAGVPTPKPSLQWSDWAASGAIINAFAFASGEQAPAPVDTSTGAGEVRRELVKIGIEQTVVYPDGRREQLPPTTVIATMGRTAAGWLLDDYR
jgi:hypothetical protein